MRYYEDMQSKYGFGNGSLVPDGIEVNRKLYVQTINRMAEKAGSNTRVAASDGGGSHNWCFIELIPVEMYEKLIDPTEDCGDELSKMGFKGDHQSDDKFNEVIEILEGIQLDDYIIVKAVIMDNAITGIEEDIQNYLNEQ